MQDSRLQSQNFVGFDCRMFPLGLNTLDNARENEIHLQLYQSYNRGESIVVGSLIISSSFNHEFVVTYTNFHQIFPSDLTDEHKLYT